jgi:hypothetical protein
MSSSPNSRVRTLERALATLGDAEHLAVYLNVQRARVEDWLAGHVEVPPEVFAAALDIVAAGPFVAWHAKQDAQRAQRHQAHADQLQGIADRIKASAERAQRIADQAQRTADRSSAIVHVERLLEDAKSDQQEARDSSVA